MDEPTKLQQNRVRQIVKAILSSQRKLRPTSLAAQKKASHHSADRDLAGIWQGRGRSEGSGESNQARGVTRFSRAVLHKSHKQRGGGCETEPICASDDETAVSASLFLLCKGRVQSINICLTDDDEPPPKFSPQKCEVFHARLTRTATAHSQAKPTRSPFENRTKEPAVQESGVAQRKVRSQSHQRQRGRNKTY